MYGMNTSTLPRTSGVYVLSCSQTGLSYVGASQNIRRRVSHHLNRLEDGTHLNPALADLYRRVGREGLLIRVAKLCHPEELNAMEAKLWSKLRKAGLLLDPDTPFVPRRVPTYSSSAKAEAMRRRWADPASRKKLTKRVNEVRATAEYRNGKVESNRAAVQTRWDQWAPLDPSAGAYKQKNGWVAQIRDEGQRVYLGTFATQEEAHAAYVEAWERKRAKRRA